MSELFGPRMRIVFEELNGDEETMATVHVYQNMSDKENGVRDGTILHA